LQEKKKEFKLYESVKQKYFRFHSYPFNHRWWKDIDVATKFPFARDRIVELFFWISGAYFEPEFAVARDILTKVIALTSILDDMYDVYGTLEELVILTEAIEKSVIHSFSQTSEFD